MEQKHYEDEISLKELILTLMKSWKMMLVITVVIMMLAAVYAFVITDEVYEASVEGTISVTESTTTKYGDYTFPSINKMDFLNVAKSEEVAEKVIKNLNLKMSTNTLINSIAITTEGEQSSFEFLVKASSQKLAKDIAKELSNVYRDSLTMKYKKNAVDTFLREYYVRVKSDAELIETQEKTISELKVKLKDINPVITLKKLVTSDPELAARIASERGVAIEELSDEVMFEEISNPSYELLESTIVTTESTLVTYKTTAEQNQKMYDELILEEKAIGAFYENGSDASLNKGTLEFMKSKVHLDSYVSSSENPVAPRKVLIVAIGFVLGLMLGVFIAFFKAYWART